MDFNTIEVDGTQIRVTADGRPDPNGRPGYQLLVNNRYSYPGLLNLALNSDLMNVTRRRLAGDNAFTSIDATTARTSGRMRSGGPSVATTCVSAQLRLLAN